MVLGASMLMPGAWLVWQAGDAFVLMAGALVLGAAFALWQGRRHGAAWLFLAGALAVGWAGLQPGLSWRQGLQQVDVLLIGNALMAWQWPRLDARIPRVLARLLALSLSVLLAWCWSAPTPAPGPTPPIMLEPAEGVELPPPWIAPDMQARDDTAQSVT